MFGLKTVNLSGAAAAATVRKLNPMKFGSAPGSWYEDDYHPPGQQLWAY